MVTIVGVQLDGTLVYGSDCPQFRVLDGKAVPIASRHQDLAAYFEREGSLGLFGLRGKVGHASILAWPKGVKKNVRVKRIGAYDSG